jgi:hypothetical protein
MPVKAVFSISIASIAPGAAGANVLHGLALSEGVFPSQLVATLIFSTFYKILPETHNCTHLLPFVIMMQHFRIIFIVKHLPLPLLFLLFYIKCESFL